MDNIDIVVPYVDENDIAWQQDYNYWREQEVKSGIQKASNHQAFGKARIRNWDHFKYWFRCVEQSCPWVHKVFLVVQRESQIPSWLNRNNPKIRIVLHEEFIPEEFLPTFNTLTIETFYYRIPDLSEHFITSNDDFFFLNPIPQNLFFNEGKIHQGLSGYRNKNWNCGNEIWSTIVNNTSDFLEKYIIKKPTEKFYHYSHLPDGRIKSYEKAFMEQYYDVITKSMKVSKFRHPKNLIPNLLFIDSMKYTGFSKLDNRVYENSRYVAVDDRTDFKQYNNLEMVCFNDTEGVGDFILCKQHMLEFFQHKFPNLSSFETYDEKPSFKVCFGVPSWLPDTEPARSQRIERLNRVFKQLHDLFEDKVDWLIIAQNWGDYKYPDYIKNIEVIHKPKLGILRARKALREEFLKRDYDYIIMLDDDLILETTKEACDKYLEEMKTHIDGFCFLQYEAAQLNLCAISRDIYNKEPIVNIDPQKNEGYEDKIYSELLHYRHPDKEFHVKGIKAIQFCNPKEKAPSTWAKNQNFSYINKVTCVYVDNFKKGNFNFAAIKAGIAKGDYYKSHGVVGDNPHLDERIKYALERQWINVNDIPRLIEQWGLK